MNDAVLWLSYEHDCSTLVSYRGDEMPLSVRVDIKTERAIRQLARNKGQTKSEVVREAIGLLARQAGTLKKAERTFDAMRDLIGCVRGGPPDLSLKTGEQFRTLLARRRKGRPW